MLHTSLYIEKYYKLLHKNTFCEIEQLIYLFHLILFILKIIIIIIMIIFEIEQLEGDFPPGVIYLFHLILAILTILKFIIITIMILFYIVFLMIPTTLRHGQLNVSLWLK